MDANPLRMSVVCPVYNTKPDLLREAVQSVISAAGPHLHELILVDDASTAPDTLKAIDEIAAEDTRIIVVHQPRNGGPGIARSTGIQIASGEWIAFTDSDDLWLPGRMEAVVSVLQSCPDAQWIVGNYESLYDDGSREPAPLISTSCPGVRIGGKLVLLQPPAITRLLIGNFWLTMCAVTIKKTAILQVTQLFSERLYYWEDTIAIAKISTKFACYFIEDAVYAYRRDVASLMSSPRRLTDAYAAGWRNAQKARCFENYRREVRWMLYSVYKGLAINNLLNGFRFRGAWFAVRAWLTDPREIGQLLLFVTIMLQKRSFARSNNESRYSSAERFDVKRKATS